MTQTAVTYSVRHVKTSHLAERVRRDLALGRDVLVAKSNEHGAVSVRGDVWLEEYDRTTPIGPGDYVRWDNPRGDTWIEGELKSIESRGDGYALAHIVAHNAAAGWRLNFEHTVGVGTPTGDRTLPATLSRIPRPEIDQVESIKVGDYVRWTLLNDGCWLEGTVKSSYRDSSCEIFIERTQNWPVAENLRFAGKFALGSTTPGVSKIEPVPRPAPEPDLVYTTYARVSVARSKDGWAVVPPAAVAVDDQIRSNIEQAGRLIDGLSLDECRDRWFRNRRRLEPGTEFGMRRPGRVAPQLEPLTPAQVAAAKAYQAERTMQWWPQELREKIAERTAAEANPVRVDMEYAPWE